MTEEKIEEQVVEEKTEEPSVMEELDEAIDQYIEDVAEREAPDDGNPPPREEPEEELVPEKEPEAEESTGEETPAVDNSLIERAVRSGMSLSDAKAIPDGEVLERIIAQAETTTGETSEETFSDEEKTEEKLLADIPELDPDEYDPDFINTFEKMKGAIVGLQETNKALVQNQRGQESNQLRGWFDSQVKSVEKDYGSTIQSDSAKGKIIRHMDFVANEARAEGRQLSHDQVFKLALESAFTEKTNEIKGRKIAAKAKGRSKRVLHKPRDVDGSFISETFSGDDRESEAVAAVRQLMEPAL